MARAVGAPQLSAKGLPNECFRYIVEASGQYVSRVSFMKGTNHAIGNPL